MTQLIEEKKEEEKAWIANGEIGYVEEVGTGHIVVRFEQPTRTVKIPTRGDDAGSIELAYAITTWKAQGSEWPIILMMIDSSGGARWIGSRELIYTGISRARNWCMTIGDIRAIDAQCRRVSLRARKTFLSERLVEEMERMIASVEGF